MRVEWHTHDRGRSYGMVRNKMARERWRVGNRNAVQLLCRIARNPSNGRS